MKKLKLLLPVVALFSLAACGTGGASSVTSGEGGSSEPESQLPSEVSSESIDQGSEVEVTPESLAALLADVAANTVDAFKQGHGAHFNVQTSDLSLTASYALGSDASVNGSLTLKAVDLAGGVNFLNDGGIEAALVSNSGIRVTGSADIGALLGTENPLPVALDLKTGPLSAYLTDNHLYFDASQNNFSAVAGGLIDTIYSTMAGDSSEVAGQIGQIKTVLSNVLDGLKLDYAFEQIPAVPFDTIPSKEDIKPALETLIAGAMENYGTIPGMGGDSSESVITIDFADFIEARAYENGSASVTVKLNKELVEKYVPAEAWTMPEAPTIRNVDFLIGFTTDENRVLNGITISESLDVDVKIQSRSISVNESFSCALTLESFGHKDLKIPATFEGYTPFAEAGFEQIMQLFGGFGGQSQPAEPAPGQAPQPAPLDGSEL